MLEKIGTGNVEYVFMGPGFPPGICNSDSQVFSFPKLPQEDKDLEKLGLTADTFFLIPTGEQEKVLNIAYRRRAKACGSEKELKEVNLARERIKRRREL